jgi:parvulin-like peptidyl-prolyl isomerase|tara:strand:+ start:285 stop:1160 length:876 start_codon:yes stop_codon:yes gene_type:complete
MDSAVVAEVGGDKIIVTDLRKEMKFLEGQFRVWDRKSLTPEELLVLKTKALNRIILNTLLVKEAARNNIQLSRDEYESALQEAKKGYQKESFHRLFSIEGISIEEWENTFKNNLLIKKLINTKASSNVPVSEGDLQRHYGDHPEEFQKGEQVRFFHIMVETENEARDIRRQLKSGKKKFSILAQEYSRSPEGANGGDLGYFEAGELPVEFSGIFKLKGNRISEIIHTPRGYHIFKVIDKKAERKMDFEESLKVIQERLFREAQDKAFQEWLVKLKNNVDIKINHDVLAQNY